MLNTSDLRNSTILFTAGETLNELPYPRFAVGSFDSWPQLQGTVDDLSQRGFSLESFHCLALGPVMAGTTLHAASHRPIGVHELTFPEGPVVCTAGLLHAHLCDRLSTGARSLSDALGYWLVLHHAAHFQTAIENGKIQLWIRLRGSEDERQACQTLLQRSSNSVGVHDLAPLPRRG